MPGQDLGLPGPHGPSKARQLHHPDTVCPGVEALQRRVGRYRVDRGVDGPQQLLALPGRGDLTGGISSCQPGP